MTGGRGWLERWKARAAELERDVYALSFAYRDPRVSVQAKMLVALVVAYALSPIDLIPDFVPILGYLDDLVIVPFGIALAVKFIPADVLTRAEAARRIAEKPRRWAGAVIVVLVWLAIAACLARVLTQKL